MTDTRMEYRNLGRTGLRTSVIGFGCSRIAGSRAIRDRDEIASTMAAVIDHGINFFDTSDSYGNGASERLLGVIARGRRDKLIICSKVGYCLHNQAELYERVMRPFARTFLRRFRLLRSAAAAVRSRYSTQNFDPQYVRSAVEDSLRRLHTDYLDMMVLHSPPLAVVDRGEVFEVLEGLKRRGSVRHYGVSFGETDYGRMTDASLRHPGVAALQVTINALRQEALTEVLPRVASQDVAVIARMPFLKGKVLDDPDLVALLGDNRDRTMAQSALRYVLQQEGVGLVLVGMGSRRHLEENLKALAVSPLAEWEMALIRKRATQGSD